ncbi:MAG: helix-turn-helix transcriptional regulator [Leptospirales bacterium]
MKKRQVTIYRLEYIKIIDKLIKARKDAGLKQSDVADLLGWHQVDVSKIEKRVRRLDIMDLIDFSKIYKKPLQFFIGHIK